MDKTLATLQRLRPGGTSNLVLETSIGLGSKWPGMRVDVGCIYCNFLTMPHSPSMKVIQSKEKCITILFLCDYMIDDVILYIFD